MRQQYTDWPFEGLDRHAYRVILADPAYKFSSGPNRNPNNHYRTLTIKQIATLPVGELAHPDGCRLFLWITFSQLHRMTELRKDHGRAEAALLVVANLGPNGAPNG
jgi:N6-adenosine-specific RNA methylase IME4